MAKSKSSDGTIIHCNSVRFRITGAGNLISTLYSLDDVNNVQLPTLPMAVTTNKEPVLLTNFREQRMYLKGEVMAINEYFIIDKIVIFVKPTATGYPQ